jgi:hypothetical protein
VKNAERPPRHPSARLKTALVYEEVGWKPAPARDYVEQVPNRIVLVDGAQLTQLVLEYGVGTRPIVCMRCGEQAPIMWNAPSQDGLSTAY